MIKPATYINTLVFSAMLFATSGNAQAAVVEIDGKPRVLISKKLPQNGMSMKQVRKRWGAPLSRTKSKGKVKKLHPRIHVWHYRGFSVYFETSRVIHSVIK